MNKINIYLIVIILGFSSCSKFLQEYSQNQVYAKTATDLNELLIGEGYMATSGSDAYGISTMSIGSEGAIGEMYCPWLNVMDDDASEFASGLPANTTDQTAINMLSGFHRWQPFPCVDATGAIFTDNNWVRFYKAIAAVNAIIYQTGQLRGKDNEVMLNKVEGEARVIRAAYYFMLANIYGKPYAKATASTDLSIPLKISENVVDKFYSRNTVAEVYNQIVADLQRASVCLNGITQPSIYRANKAAAFTLLSRVYLYMEDYQLAINAADSVINTNNYKITDLNSVTANSTYDFTVSTSSETIFSMGSYNSIATFVEDMDNYAQYPPVASAASYQVSADLLSAYSAADLRIPSVASGTTYSAFFTRLGTNTRVLPRKYRNISNAKTTGVSDMFLIRYPEVYLNKAEAQALLSKSTEAQATIQLLRAKRISTANLTSVILTGEALVNFIRDERRRELCFEGQRWFDLKRYAVNSVYPYTKAINHPKYVYDANAMTWYQAGYYQLKPYLQDKAAYVIPIPASAIVFNQGTLTNEDRPVRSMSN